MDCLGEDGALRRGAVVPFTTDKEDEWAEKEDDGRQRVGQPEANVLKMYEKSGSVVVFGNRGRSKWRSTHLFRVCHADLADERTDVDEEVEVLREDPSRQSLESRHIDEESDHIYTSGGHCWVHDNPLALGRFPDVRLQQLLLLSDKRGDIALETSRAKTHYEHGDDKTGKRAVRVLKHGRKCGNDEDNMSD